MWVLFNDHSDICVEDNTWTKEEWSNKEPGDSYNELNVKEVTVSWKCSLSGGNEKWIPYIIIGGETSLKEVI
jgi:hypothetical protein